MTHRKRKNGLIVAIDGPSGAGKSTLARMLAERLGYMQIDTGAMYRAAALLMSKNSLNIDDSASLTSFCNGLDVKLERENGTTLVFANGIDVTAEIRTPEVSLLTSKVSALKPVRDAMVSSQRSMGECGGVVLDGRDIGTVVFPDADIKFFLTASPQERGKRRFMELSAKGQEVTLEDTVRQVEQRDLNDSMREIAPLKMADDAILLDSSGMSPDDVLRLMEQECLNTIERLRS